MYLEGNRRLLELQLKYDIALHVLFFFVEPVYTYESSIPGTFLRKPRENGAVSIVHPAIGAKNCHG